MVAVIEEGHPSSPYRRRCFSQLLGIEPSGYFEADKLSALVEQTPAKAQHVALAIVLAACESVTSKQILRSPSATDADYFTQLAG